MTKVTSAELLASAEAAITFISIDDAMACRNRGDVVFVDIRDSKELEAGAIPGAVHAPRGGLEFALDPSSAMAVADLNAGKRLVMVCGSGGRASFATNWPRTWAMTRFALRAALRLGKRRAARLLNGAARRDRLRCFAARFASRRASMGLEQ